jgi:hypothetical protein
MKEFRHTFLLSPHGVLFRFDPNSHQAGNEGRDAYFRDEPSLKDNDLEQTTIADTIDDVKYLLF